MRWSRTLLIPLLLFLAAAVAVPQQQGTAVPGAEPYDPAEFPSWALAMRRAEIIAFGSLPFTLAASRLLYTVGRFVVKSIAARAIDLRYAPPLVAPPGAIPLERSDMVWIVSGGAALSVGVAVIDYLLGRREAEPDE